MSAQQEIHGKYVVEKVIGQGGEGVAYLVKQNTLAASDSVDSFDELSSSQSTGTSVAASQSSALYVMKGRTCYSQEEANTALQEALAMARVSSPYCIPLRDVFVEQAKPGKDNPTEAHSYVYIVSDYCDSGDLLELILKIQDGELPHLTAVQLRAILFDVTRAVLAVHAAHLSHRDIKPENIFSTSSGRFMLGDFGLASALKCAGPAGTWHYFAPELMDKSKVVLATNAVDVWALGVVAFELASGKLLRSFREHPIGIECLDDNFDLNILMRTAISSDELRDAVDPFLKMCLEKRPEKRVSAQQLMASPFFKSLVHRDSSPDVAIGGLLRKRATLDMVDQVAHFFVENLIDLQPYKWFFEPLAAQVPDRKTLVATIVRTLWRFEAKEFISKKQVIVLIDNGTIVAGRVMLDHRDKFEVPVGTLFKILKEMRKDDNNMLHVIKRLIRHSKWLNNKALTIAKKANGGKLKGINLVFYWAVDPNFQAAGETLLDDICVRCDEEGILLATVTGDEPMCRSFVGRGAEVTKIEKGLASKGLVTNILS